jgi:diguanylate cyclase (GGDEF)-like protein
MLDIDYFKEYNDQFGHSVGDEVLVRVSRFLMRSTRAEEGVVRFGGDEFCVLLAGSDAANTSRAAERIKQTGARELPIAFSVGWAVREHNERLERTLNRADQNLLEVRSLDRGREERRRP